MTDEAKPAERLLVVRQESPWIRRAILLGAVTLVAGLVVAFALWSRGHDVHALNPVHEETLRIAPGAARLFPAQISGAGRGRIRAVVTAADGPVGWTWKNVADPAHLTESEIAGLRHYAERVEAGQTRVFTNEWWSQKFVWGLINLDESKPVTATIKLEWSGEVVR
jgi:hypothetical protein